MKKPPVFGRRLHGHHPYEDSLITLSRSGKTKNDTLANRALAFNIRYDHRVSLEREEAFHPHFVKLKDMKKALKDYYESRIRTQPDPDYTSLEINANNLINGLSFSCLEIKKSQDLVRALDLNGLGTVFRRAREEGYGGKVFDTFPESLHDQNSDPNAQTIIADAIMKWLDDKLDKGSNGERQDFIEQVLDALSWFGQDEPYQPTWATLWSCFAGIEKEPPNRWLEAVGVHKEFKMLPRWVILLRYPIREAGVIARPTLLDSNTYPYHFPSPPQAPLIVGGHPMDLRISPKATQLLPEVIHNQIPHSIKHWVRAGRMCDKIIPQQTVNIREQRKNHHALLVEKYGTGVYNWMRSPI